jgi:hypothetical protein
MQQNESSLLALVVILVIVVIYQNRGTLGEKSGFYNGAVLKHTGAYSAEPGVTTPYVPLHHYNSLYRQSKIDGNDPRQSAAVGNMAKNYAYWATKPRDIEEQQRNAWFEAVSGSDHSGPASFDPSKQNDPAGATSEYHEPGPSLNYQEALIDLVADSRMRAAHDNWHGEVAPFSQTSMKVDTMDEAATMSAVPRHGLYAFRLAAPAVHNPQQLTDQDGISYAQQHTGFSFGG